MNTENLPKPGEIVKQQAYICLSGDDLAIFLFKPESKYFLCLGETEITYTMPNYKDINSLQVEALEKQLEEEKASHHLRITHIKEQIQSLLAISHEPTHP